MDISLKNAEGTSERMSGAQEKSRRTNLYHRRKALKRKKVKSADISIASFKPET